jgi:phosphoribosylformimino-5-aminoimidazole carboxamide ribotide isomerase
MSPSLTIIPAIDLKGGKAVRLRQGKEAEATIYGDDPVEVAEEWVRQGARRLHIVDLDGAFGRTSGHLSILQRIAARVDAVIEFGGGLRTVDAIRGALEAGASKVVLGTMAVEDPTRAGEAVRLFGADQIIVAVDASEGRVAVRGWRDLTSIQAVDLSRILAGEGVWEILYTDIARDGMLSGPDLTRLPDLVRTGVSVLVSGGVSSADDVRAIAALGEPGITGVIVGKALYEKQVTVAGLQQAAGER